MPPTVQVHYKVNADLKPYKDPVYTNLYEARRAYDKEMLLPSYMGQGHIRRVEFLKITTIVEDMTDKSSTTVQELCRELLARGNAYHTGPEPSVTAQLCTRAAATLLGVQKQRNDMHNALHILVMLREEEDTGCIPPPTKEQWEQAWSEAEELVRREP